MNGNATCSGCGDPIPRSALREPPPVELPASPGRWAAEPDETHTDECPHTGLPVVYHLREVVRVEPKD